MTLPGDGNKILAVFDADDFSHSLGLHLPFIRDYPPRTQRVDSELTAAIRPRQLPPQLQTSIKIPQRGAPACNLQAHS